MVNHSHNRTVIDMNDIKVNLTEIYLNHPSAFEEWLVSDGNEDLIKRIAEIKLRQNEAGISDRSEEKTSLDKERDIRDDGRTRRKPIERNNSVTSELFQVWVSSSPKKIKSQNG